MAVGKKNVQVSGGPDADGANQWPDGSLLKRQ